MPTFGGQRSYSIHTFLCCCAVQVTRRLVSQTRDTTMASVSYQTHSRFTFLSDTFRTVRIVFRTVPLNDTVKKAITKTKTEALRDTPHRGNHHLTPACAVSRQAEPLRRSLKRQREGNRTTKQIETGPWQPRARDLWRPEFDLGWACSGLPLNAGRDTQRAACGTWSRLMRKRKHSSWQKWHSSLLPPHSIFLWIPLFVSFPTFNRFQHLARCGSIHHRGYFLSLLPSKTLI